MSRRKLHRIAIIALNLIAGAVLGNGAFAQTAVLLRDFSPLAAAVASYDEDGVHLQNGDVICWSRVASANVPPADQTQVNRWMQTIGRPLARLKWRLEIGDVAGAVLAADELPPEILNRPGFALYWTQLARASQAIARGNSRPAALHWIAALSFLADHPKWTVENIPTLDLPSDPLTMLHPQIIPIWELSADSAKDWQTAQKFLAEHDPEKLPVAALTYLAVIAIDERQFEVAESLVGLVSQTSADWSDALRWKLEIESAHGTTEFADRLREVENWPVEARALATIWLAMPGLNSSSRTEFDEAAVLALSIPARYHRSHPELSATILWIVARRAEALGDDATAKKLYNELRTNYSSTNVVRGMPAPQ